MNIHPLSIIQYCARLEPHLIVFKLKKNMCSNWLKHVETYTEIQHIQKNRASRICSIIVKVILGMTMFFLKHAWILLSKFIVISLNSTSSIMLRALWRSVHDWQCSTVGVSFYFFLLHCQCICDKLGHCQPYTFYMALHGGSNSDSTFMCS